MSVVNDFRGDTRRASFRLYKTTLSYETIHQVPPSPLPRHRRRSSSYMVDVFSELWSLWMEKCVPRNDQLVGNNMADAADTSFWEEQQKNGARYLHPMFPNVSEHTTQH